MLINFLIAIAVFSYAVYRAIQERNNFRVSSGLFTSGISIAVMVLVLPYFFAETGDYLFTLFKSFRYGLSVITMGANQEVAEFFTGKSILTIAYKALLYLFYILGPLATSAFLISFSRHLVEFLKLTFYRKMHCFSSLNDRSLLLAESIKKERPGELIVFCAFDQDSSEEMQERASAIGAMKLEKGVAEFRVFKKKIYTFYLLEHDSKNGLALLSALCSHLINSPGYVKQNVTVRYNAAASSIELIRDIDNTFGADINLRPIDIYASQAIDILARYKYILAGKPHKEIVIIGAGGLGIELLRHSVILMIEPESDYTVHVIDKNARQILSGLKEAYPEVFNLSEEEYIGNTDNPDKNYDIRFHIADTDTYAISRLFEDIQRPDVIFVATGNDKSNYETSKRIMRFFGSRSGDMSYPPICARIKSPELYDVITGHDGLEFFGNEKELYDLNRLLSPSLEEAAKRVHLAYFSDIYPRIFNRNYEDREEILEYTGFYSYINQDSSFNEALALDFKYEYVLSKRNGDEDEIDFVRRWLNDQNNLIILSDAEHLRWNAYQRFQGWRHMNAVQEDLAARKSLGKRVKDNDMLLHPALVELNELPEAERITDEIIRRYNPGGTPSRYVELDRNICRNMLLILGLDE